ncbi:unnamed protein product [Pylaiella littoralis]
MPPTDFFDDSASGCASMSCVPESRLLPTTRSPLHHGTEPDLSAHLPMTDGVAAKGLDLSPVMGPAAGGTTSTMAKRKLRGSPARGSCAGAQGGRRLVPSMSADRYSSSRDACAIAAAAAAAAAAGVADMRPSSENHRGAAASAAAAAAANLLPPPSPTSGGSIYSNGDAVSGTKEGGVSPSEVPPSRPSPQQQTGGATGASGGSSISSALVDVSEAGARDEGPPALAPLGYALPAPAAGCVSGASNNNEGAGMRQQQHQELKKKRQQVDIKGMMVKARKAADNIRLLLHAKRCEGDSCQEPGCESARQLVSHMRDCHLTRGAGCSPKCVQAQKMLRHYAECNRRRALGGRYCLVCSLVARSATTGNHQANSNVMATSGGGTPQANQRRQPLGLLGPGTGPRAGPSVQQHQARASKLGQEGAAGMSPSVAISRVRRGGGASPQQRQGLQVSFQQQQKMGTPKDGKFYRPSPRIRRGSWGGYDRSRFLRRTRFDSIPEEVPEEDCEDEYDEETASDAGSKSTKGDGNSDRAKTLLSSISL